MSETTFTPPPPPAAPGPVAGPQFDFAKPFTFVFEDPRWVQKILIGGLFYLASFLLIGVFFILGYLARMTRNVIRGEARPLPEWDDLGGMFAEGAVILGAVFVYVLPLFVLMLMIIIPSAILSAASEHEAVQALSSGLTGCLACLMVPISLAFTLFVPAAMLFLIVERRFGAAFEFRRIWDFIKNNIGNYLLAIVVSLVARMIGGLGIILLCIGVIFTGFWSFLIGFHAFGQVYRIRR